MPTHDEQGRPYVTHGHAIGEFVDFVTPVRFCFATSVLRGDPVKRERIVNGALYDIRTDLQIWLSGEIDAWLESNG